MGLRNALSSLGKLAIHDFDKPVEQLVATKALALANVLTEPDLLLDEPANHLDLEMVEWLEFSQPVENDASHGYATAIFSIVLFRYFRNRPTATFPLKAITPTI